MIVPDTSLEGTGKPIRKLRFPPDYTLRYSQPRRKGQDSSLPTPARCLLIHFHIQVWSYSFVRPTGRTIIAFSIANPAVGASEYLA